MIQTISSLSIAVMVLAVVFSILLPVGLFIYYRKKGADIPPFFIGCAVMLLFAFIIESLVHQVVLNMSPVGEVIINNVALYALYGGLMAGLFEETGRFVAFKTVLKKYRGKDINALMYGAGHGGFEVIVVLGITMIGNIYLSVMANTGALSLLTANAPAEAAATLQTQIDALAAIAPATFLLGMIERVSAVIAHLSFSVLVWFAVKKGKTILYPVAILLHALLDFATVMIYRSEMAHAEIVTEIVIFIIVVIFAVFARIIWNREKDTAAEPVEM
ncbi:YhfC family intramembrane metalloprotease [Butyrivibrio sp. FCS014]|uniref:YhfC family intramembrane metalloprotease n=1 Tax=Butyrivibrio sp. FCS014 TaxID=1408304 RepID=UPI0004663599|nr:YhfC family glutamic-type intramembrane protease [Butyrivibrio sp. FCS014]